jgi:hypothetical protein
MKIRFFSNCCQRSFFIERNFFFYHPQDFDGDITKGLDSFICYECGHPCEVTPIDPDSWPK